MVVACRFLVRVFFLTLFEFCWDTGLAPTGSIEIGELGTYSYTYNPTQKNFNARTLQRFSTEAEEKMYNCGPACPYKTYNKFYEYYGVFDYANQWVLAAFNKGGTNFAKGDAQFNVYGMEGTNGKQGEMTRTKLICSCVSHP